MIYIGDYRCIPSDYTGRNMVILNLSGLTEGYQRVNLIPQKDSRLDFMDDNNFDLMYFNYIFSNNFTFSELMKIILNLYQGKTVFLLVTRNEWFDRITESLMKVIQQRYGCTYMVLNDPADMISQIEENSIDEGFSITGLSCLDQDMQRFEYDAVRYETERTIQEKTKQGDGNGTIWKC